METKDLIKVNPTTTLMQLRKQQLGGDISVRPQKSRQDFLNEFNPDIQTVVCRDPEKCWFGKYPTLEQLNRIYGDNTSEDWLTAQLDNLMLFCGCKGKLNSSQLFELSNLISNSYPYLRISEIMLFFNYLKRGKYEKFYGSIDPIKIMMSLDVFVSETRSIAYAAKEEEIAKEYLKACQASAITEEEYLVSKGLPKSASRLDKLIRFKPAKPRATPEASDMSVLNSALALVNNIYGYDEAVLGKMCEAWKKRYGYTPQQYVSNQKKED